MPSKKAKQTIYDKFGPAMVVLLIGLAFAVGALWQKVEYLEKGTTVNTAGNTTTGTSQQAQQPPDPTEPISQAAADKIPPVTAEDHIRGSIDAPVKIIEYSDFECPYCASFHPSLIQAMGDYEGQVAWVYRHFPLSFHPEARPAAIASECVAQLGGSDAFWAFGDAIFEDQETTLSDLSATAASVGIGQAAFEACVDADEYGEKIDDHYNTGISAGVSGTPGTFIINSDGTAWQLNGAVGYSTLSQVIDAALDN